MQLDPDFKTQLMIIGIAITGSFARYSNELLSGKKFVWVEALSTFFLSVFSGYLFGTFALSFDASIHYVIIFSGVGSFMGQNSVQYLYSFITKEKQ